VDIKVQQQKCYGDFCVLGVNKRGYFQSLCREGKISGFLVASTFVLTSVPTDQANINMCGLAPPRALL